MSSAASPSSAGFSIFRIMPGLRAFSGRPLGDLRYDLIAAITLAAYLLPSNIGDASLAGLPPQAGLYTCLFGGLVFWLFCSSRHTAISATSAISLLIGSTLGDMAGNDASRIPALAACTALMVGALAFIAWAVRAGVLVNFISETALIGFKCGVALHLASTQLPKLFGFKGAHGDFWHRIGYFFSHLGETHTLSLVVGCVALAIILAGKTLLKNKPVALFVMIGAIVLATLMDFEGRGMKTLGEIPAGLPVPALPAVGWSDVRELLPLAMACFLLGAVETAAIGRTFALKHGYRLDANQEFLSLSASNLAAGFGSAFPISGGMSQSLVNESAGARTPLSGLFASLIILVVVLFFSGLLENLPQPVLAAIVLAAVTGLFNVKALKHLWHFNRGEFAVAIAALLGVLFAGLLQGVLIGAILSLVILLRRASRPHTTELGRVPGTDYFADMTRHPENKPVPGVLVFRAASSLLYFNVEHVRDRFTELLAQRSDVKLVIFFMGTVPMVDLAGAELLADIHDSLKSRGIKFGLAEARGSVRDALRRAGYEQKHGQVQANQTVAELIGSALPGEVSWIKPQGGEKPVKEM